MLEIHGLKLEALLQDASQSDPKTYKDLCKSHTGADNKVLSDYLLPFLVKSNSSGCKPTSVRSGKTKVQISFTSGRLSFSKSFDLPKDLESQL